MSPDGWEIKPFNRGEVIEIVYWDDGEKAIEFTVTRAQFEEQIHALVDAK